jgi:hypothetical protein
MKRLVELVVVFCALLGAMFAVWAAPASAHTVSGATATNYRSHLDSLLPSTPGISFAVREVGNRVQLTNTSSQEVTVLGYSGEPYMRVGPKGVFVNERSPAYYLNRSATYGQPVPASADARATPQWKKTSSGHVVAWHDHRVHWAATNNPPQVTSDPGARHVIDPHWTVDMQYNGHPLTATGDLTWIPGPSKVGWIGGTVIVLIVAVAALLRLRTRAAIAVAMAMLVIADVTHTLGNALDLAGPLTSRLASAAQCPSLVIVVRAVGSCCLQPVSSPYWAASPIVRR